MGVFLPSKSGTTMSFLRDVLEGKKCAQVNADSESQRVKLFRTFCQRYVRLSLRTKKLLLNLLR